jgi:hypothetical protein
VAMISGQCPVISGQWKEKKHQERTFNFLATGH